MSLFVIADIIIQIQWETSIEQIKYGKTSENPVFSRIVWHNIFDAFVANKNKETLENEKKESNIRCTGAGMCG